MARDQKTNRADSEKSEHKKSSTSQDLQKPVWQPAELKPNPPASQPQSPPPSHPAPPDPSATSRPGASGAHTKKLPPGQATPSSSQNQQPSQPSNDHIRYGKPAVPRKSPPQQQPAAQSPPPPAQQPPQERASGSQSPQQSRPPQYYAPQPPSSRPSEHQQGTPPQQQHRPPPNYGQQGPLDPTQRIPPAQSRPASTYNWNQPTAGTRRPPQSPPPRRGSPPPPPSVPPLETPETSGKGLSLAQVLLWITLSGVILFFLGLVAASIGYIVLAAQLPSPDELRAREPNFASSRIYDRNEDLLYEIMDPNTGKRTYVHIDQIARSLQLATVATEDRNFYDHVGFDPIAIARAVYYALQEREIVSGASTITQQVARNIFMDLEERTEVSASRKIKEIILAAELTRKYSKEEILEIYLNNNNYGNLAYGIDAAARTYFNTTASNLTLAQASFLAGLPQAPAMYDPYGGRLDAALKRQKTVLGLMVEDGYITQAQADTAAAEMAAYQFPEIYRDRIPAPHFVFYVRQWVEEHLGADRLYQGGGLRIYTTLEPQLQAIAEEEVRQGIANLAGRNVSNGALVAIEPPTGYILAMVGSVDFYNKDIGGQVNVLQRCRQPGSAIKPLTYLAALERGWTPATIVWDVPTTYTDTAGNIYQPVNYDGQFRGATSVRTALANSLNIPAVKTLEFVTVNGLLAISERLGVTSLISPQLECPDYPYTTRPLYGLALTLGGGEVKPIELAAAYATFANNGHYLPPTPILRIEDSEGNVLVNNQTRPTEQVVSPQHTYLLNHILSDTQARCLVFNCPSILELPDRPVAAKTGTTNDNRDAWTVGYTPDLAVGVWVGNNDNSEMLGVVGSSGAGPIWNAFMRRAHASIPPHPFPRPPGIVEHEVCTLSGTEPGRYCPERKREVFFNQQLPPGQDNDWFQPIKIDAGSGLRANAFCTSNVIEKVMLVLDPVEESMAPNDPRRDPGGRRWLEQWAVQNNIEIAPSDYCTEGEQEPTLNITHPTPGENLSGAVEVRGTVDIPEFDHYEITYGVGDNPQGWGWISGPHEAIVRDGLLGIWEAAVDENPGTYTVRVVAYNRRGTQFEAQVTFNLEAPTPTPTPTPEPTATATATSPATPTSEATSTATPAPTQALPTNTPLPTLAPVSPTPTAVPATETPVPTQPPATTEPTPTLPPTEAPTQPPEPTLPPATATPTPEAS